MEVVNIRIRQFYFPRMSPTPVYSEMWTGWFVKLWSTCRYHQAVKESVCRPLPASFVWQSLSFPVGPDFIINLFSMTLCIMSAWRLCFSQWSWTLVTTDLSFHFKIFSCIFFGPSHALISVALIGSAVVLQMPLLLVFRTSGDLSILKR